MTTSADQVRTALGETSGATGKTHFSTRIVDQDLNENIQ
jgi:hypothetical protein